MTSQLNPYLQFDGNAREAMERYRDIFGGELDVTTFGDFGLDGPPDLIMHAVLRTPTGFVLMGSDTPPGMSYAPTGNVGISLFGDDEQELRGYWDRLADGAAIGMALERQMWGDLYGQCVDRFGISWMVNIAAA
jgi:PhnB protein